MLWDMPFETLSISFIYISACAFICGWITEGVIGYAAFGIIGNWLLLLLGSYGGLIAMNLIGYRIGPDTALTLIFAFAGALTLLLLMAMIKGFLERHA